MGSQFATELVDVLGESGIEGIDISGFISSHLDPAPFSESQAHEANAEPSHMPKELSKLREQLQLRKQQKGQTDSMRDAASPRGLSSFLLIDLQLF